VLLALASTTTLDARVVEIRVYQLPQPRDGRAHPSEFYPDQLIIAAGDTVRWVWAVGDHTTTSGNPDSCAPDGSFDEPISASSPTFERVFYTPGIHAYFCEIHCEQAMNGYVIVTPPPAVLPRSWGQIKARFDH